MGNPACRPYVRAVSRRICYGTWPPCLKFNTFVMKYTGRARTLDKYVLLDINYLQMRGMRLHVPVIKKCRETVMLTWFPPLVPIQKKKLLKLSRKTAGRNGSKNRAQRDNAVLLVAKLGDLRFYNIFHIFRVVILSPDRNHTRTPRNI